MKEVTIKEIIRVHKAVGSHPIDPSYNQWSQDTKLIIAEYRGSDNYPDIIYSWKKRLSQPPLDLFSVEEWIARLDNKEAFYFRETLKSSIQRGTRFPTNIFNQDSFVLGFLRAMETISMAERPYRIIQTIEKKTRSLKPLRQKKGPLFQL